MEKHTNLGKEFSQWNGLEVVVGVVLRGGRLCYGHEGRNDYIIVLNDENIVIGVQAIRFNPDDNIYQLIASFSNETTDWVIEFFQSLVES